MAEAQSSLEYLIIISVTLAIVAITTAIVVNSFSAQSSDYAYNSCREAASRCKMAISGNPSEPCIFCNNACNYSNGTEIFSGAVTCCRLGKPSEIYSGSIGTNCVLATPPTPICGDGNIDSPEVCEGPGDPCGTAGTCSSDCLTCVEPPAPTCPNGVKDGIEQCDPPDDCACPGQCRADCTCPTISFQEWNIGEKYDLAYGIRSVAIGNADNIAGNEIVLALPAFQTFFPGIVSYKYNTYNGAWQKTNIAMGILDASFVAIGNADNVDGNEIIASLGGENKVVMYSGGSWTKSDIGATRYQVLSISIGNADNLDGNEIAIGTNAGSEYENVTRLYSYKSDLGKWNETNISWMSCCDAISTAIGDADNLAGNELVVGIMGGWIAFYEYSGGTWRNKYDPVKDPITGLSNSMVIGNADNQVGNEIVLGISNKLIMYKYQSGLFVPWVRTVIPSTATGEFKSVAIGDADNDGYNEIVLGTSNGQLRMYKYLCGQWKEIIVGTPNKAISSVAIGDADNVVGNGNEIVIGLGSGGSTEDELKLYRKV